MTKVEVEMLTGQHNYAVLQLPERSFPGIVFSAGSLSVFVGDARELAAAAHPDPEIHDLAQYMADEFGGILDDYAGVLAACGIRPSYGRP
ncbi:hypothetical protein QRX50_35835 [Amycolatopsis carbonis]|uniref:Uncharacterized protein n=1 Tax=Amycolatopsis carbonis TaxID=715471 RepID=A0A9Y2IC26_9PSEU|nr:hypothetical protein [Amycolatopsis sp. 2-15]WIX76774.1 hypothetical protein QRX50_35835 [Amycolatopsis sp. 2-15]